uniref:Immunoglobulin V-set domain-containing protein n=1 Tax=Chelonoidis abingdonii TaxID=106734 RepID=A0A8C0GQQ1_CHEAB
MSLPSVWEVVSSCLHFLSLIHFLISVPLPFPDLEMVRRVQGGAFTTMCHYNQHEYSQREKFWCKELSDLECRTIVQSSPAAGRNSLKPPNARVSLKDLGIGWISVSMTELRVEDSGIYWCGVSYHMKIIPLKKIKVAVSYEGELQISEEQVGTQISSNKVEESGEDE